MNNSILYIVVPCYNEEKVLPITYKLFLDELHHLIDKGQVGSGSRILFVNDGSSDTTWSIIESLAHNNPEIIGISQSCNRGHQCAVLAGLMEAQDECDMAVSIDCDGQDDIRAIEQMVDAYHKGYDVVYGVRSNRDSDSFFKKYTAQTFYWFLNKMGVNAVYNHADYRLLSHRAITALSQYKEVNLFLRGLIPLIGFRHSTVYYSRTSRIAGESHYPLGKMISLAIDGITSLSIRPIRLITLMGFVFSLISFLFIIVVIVGYFQGNTISGWASLMSVVCFLGGVNLICLGIIGEYVGKIYLETKSRPRYIISERTSDHSQN